MLVMHASRADPVAARCRPGVDSHVAYYDFPASIPQVLDILFVIDHTTAMAPYQTEIDGLPAGVEAALLDPTGAQADLRIAVTTVDAAGAFRQPSATTDGFLALGYDGHLARAANYTGSLADALAPLIDVGASAAITSQPLAAAKAALDAHPTFLRSTAALGIVTITASDDASTGAVEIT